jgi:hypothetical protein
VANQAISDFARNYVNPTFSGTLGPSVYDACQWVKPGVDPIEAQQKLQAIMFQYEWDYVGLTLKALRERLEAVTKKLKVN